MPPSSPLVSLWTLPPSSLPNKHQMRTKLARVRMMQLQRHSPPLTTALPLPKQACLILVLHPRPQRTRRRHIMPLLRESGMKGKKVVQQGVVTRIPFSANVFFHKTTRVSLVFAPVIIGHVQICFISLHYSHTLPRQIRLLFHLCLYFSHNCPALPCLRYKRSRRFRGHPS